MNTERKNFEDIEAIDVPLFNKKHERPAGGEDSRSSYFRFLKGTKDLWQENDLYKEQSASGHRGIHALNEQLTCEIPKEDKFKIYISPSDAAEYRQPQQDRHYRSPHAQKACERL